MPRAYYNEIDPFAAKWLDMLQFMDLIAPGDVDTRSIVDVQPDDLKGYTQCHFFAGIGVWSLALRNAGWRDDEPVWTGSCPCQPFSAAGKQKGTADARHLWPAWFRLIRECRPGVVFGEQVSAAIRQGWLDLVSTDLEGADYRIGSAVLGAHSVGAPHIRQRLYFVADSERRAAERHGLTLAGAAGGMQSEVGAERLQVNTGDGFNADVLAHAERDAGESGWLAIEPAKSVGTSGAGAHAESGRRGVPDELGDPHHQGPQGRGLRGTVGGGDGAGECAVGEAGALDGLMADSDGGIEGDGDVQRSGEHGQQQQEDGRISFWSACDWLPCIDGKARPVEPGTFPLVNGAPARVGRLRAYGNALVAPCAQTFIEAYREVRGD